MRLASPGAAARVHPAQRPTSASASAKPWTTRHDGSDDPYATLVARRWWQIAEGRSAASTLDRIVSASARPAPATPAEAELAPITTCRGRARGLTAARCRPSTGRTRRGLLALHADAVREGVRLPPGTQQRATHPVGRRARVRDLLPPAERARLWRCSGSGRRATARWCDDRVAPAGGEAHRVGVYHVFYRRHLTQASRRMLIGSTGCPSRRPTSSTSAARSRARSRANLRGAGPERRPRLAEGRPRRRRRGPRRAGEVGRRDRVQPRPGALPDRRDDGGARGRVRRAHDRPRRGRAGDRPLGLVRRASPTSSPRCSAPRTLSPGRTSTSRCRSRPASSRSSPPRSRRCSGSSRGSRPRSSAATRPLPSPPRESPLAAVELAEVLATSDLPGGVVNLLTGHRAELAPWLASHMDVNAIDVTGADGLRADWSAPPPRT